MAESPISPMFRKKLESFKPDSLIKVIIKPTRHFKLEESLAHDVEKDAKFALDNYKKIREIEKAHINSLKDYLEKAGVEYTLFETNDFAIAKMKKDDIYKLSEQPFVGSISDF